MKIVIKCGKHFNKMSNALNLELKGKTVLVKAEHFKEGTGPIRMYFVCEDGFGCDSFTSGTKIFGHWKSDGEKGMINGYSVEKIIE